jgi:hypothetical protein
MHVPEVQRPRARSASQGFRSSTSTTSQGYLHTQPSPDHTVHSTVDLPHPNYGATPPAIPTTEMIPGGFSAPYTLADQQQQPRTHGLDYSQWVATFNQGQQQQHPYGAQHHYTQPQQAPPAHQHQQSQPPVFGGQFHPSTSALVGNGRQPRDSLGELPPRIGGAYQSTAHQGYYIHSNPSPPSILTQEEQAQIYSGYSGYDPTPPPQVSPAASTSPTDTAPAGASAVPGRARPKRKRAKRAEVNELGSGDESDDGGGGAIRVGSDAFSTRL